MDFKSYIIPQNIKHYRADKPLQSVYLEFVQHNADRILDIGEFVAFVHWLEAFPVCMPIPVKQGEAVRIAREFLKALRKEQKAQ